MSGALCQDSELRHHIAPKQGTSGCALELRLRWILNQLAHVANDLAARALQKQNQSRK